VNIGAAAVVGVDISPKLIDLAKQRSSASTIIRYECADMLKLSYDNKFDVVISMFALHYSSNKLEFQSSIEIILRALKPGGRAVVLMQSPVGTTPEKTAKLNGFGVTLPDRVFDGDKIKSNFYKDGDLYQSVDIYYYSKQFIEDTCTKAPGCSSFRWLTFKVSDAALLKYSWSHVGISFANYALFEISK